MRILFLLMILSLIPLTGAQESAGRDGALKAIDDAKGDILEMEELGIGTAFTKDALKDAENALLNEDYPRVLEKVQAISKRKTRAMEILDSIRALELRIGEVSEIGDTSKAEEELSKANAAFKNENYEEAEDAIFEGERDLRRVEGEYSIVKARYSAARDNTVSYVKEKWKRVVFFILLLTSAIVVVYNRISRARGMKKLEDMRLERRVLNDLMKEVQRDYFNESKISRRLYDLKMRKYREKMLELDETIPILESQLGNY